MSRNNTNNGNNSQCSNQSNTSSTKSINIKDQIIQYFDRFYQTTLKQHISNPIINSQWVYFCTMLRTEPFDQDRVDLYLNILHNQNSKNNNRKSYGTNNNNNNNQINTNANKPTQQPLLSNNNTSGNKKSTSPVNNNNKINYSNDRSTKIMNQFICNTNNNNNENGCNYSNKGCTINYNNNLTSNINSNQTLNNITNFQFENNYYLLDLANRQNQCKVQSNNNIDFCKKNSQQSSFNRNTFGNAFEGINLNLKKTESSNSSNPHNNKSKDQNDKQRNNTPLKRLNYDFQNRKLTDAAQALLKIFQDTHKGLRC